METYAEVQKNYALQRMRAKTTSETYAEFMALWEDSWKKTKDVAGAKNGNNKEKGKRL